MTSFPVSDLNIDVDCSVKNVTEYRQNLIKGFLAGTGGKVSDGKATRQVKSNCPHCKVPIRNIRDENFNSIFFKHGMKKKGALRVLEYRKKQELKR